MTVDRSSLPALGPESMFAFPEIRRRTLANGLRVCTIEHRAVPVVSLLVLLPVGSAADPPGLPGAAAVTADLLDEGAGDMDALALHDALGRTGAQFDTDIGADATVLTLNVLDRWVERGAGLLADMLIRPRLEPGDVERVRELRLNRMIQLRDMPPMIADRAFTRLLYGDHPYGHLSIGSEDSLRAMTRDDVAGFHSRFYAPSNVTVIAAGHGTHDRLAALVESAFGDWRGAAGSDPAPPDGELPEPAGRLTLLHRPGAAQSELRIGHVAEARSTPDYHALLALNLVLGGQFVSRINMRLREEKGYTYGARTSFEFRRGRGPFVLQASVQSDATADAIEDVFSEIRAIRADRPVTRAELELGRAALTRGYPRNFETSDQVCRAAAQLALYGLPDDYFTTFVPRVLALDEADLTRAARRCIDPDRLVTVIVGDRDTVAPTLDRLALGEATELTGGSP
jgi:predicted Zn-dependent peptidase